MPEVCRDGLAESLSRAVCLCVVRRYCDVLNFEYCARCCKESIYKSGDMLVIGYAVMS